jgi:hypothetical protein
MIIYSCAVQYIPGQHSDPALNKEQTSNAYKAKLATFYIYIIIFLQFKRTSDHSSIIVRPPSSPSPV